MLTIAGYDRAANAIQTLEWDQIVPWLARPDTALWIDLEGKEVQRIKELAAIFHLHPLPVEDTLEVKRFSQPKADDFGEYLFVVLHSARWDNHADAPVLREMDIFLGARYLITAHAGPTRPITETRDLCSRRPELLKRGPAFLLHHLLDILVTNFMPVIELIDKRLDDAQQQVFDNPRPEVLNKVFGLKRGLLKFRRVVGAERDTILALTRDEFDEVVPEARPYFRDVYDRLARLSDLLEGYRDEIATLLEIYLSIVSNRLNLVMKTLTIIATVLMSLSLVVGYYGMNFQIAEYKWPHGELYVLALMVVVGALSWWYMKRKKFL